MHDTIANELANERAHVDAAWARVRAMRAETDLVAAQAGARVDTRDLPDGWQFTRDVAVSHAAYRRAALTIERDRLCVGRIDGSLGGEPSATLYIGRASIADEEGEPLVIDWRAPIAAAFYRARPGDTMGVRRRRHFRWQAGELAGLDDEVLDAAGLRDGSLHLVGEGALLAALEAPRTGRMADIVGTIQADQDRIIRRPARGITIVEGGPGTGKTAVALHRAAYLLYELSARGDQTAVCFVGPNRTFLRYVSDVVPSLGEDQIVLAVPSDFGPAVTVAGTDEPEAERVKGDVRMAAFLRRAVEGFEQPAREPHTIRCGRYRLHVTVADTRRIVRRARRAAGTHNERRRQVARDLYRQLEDVYRSRLHSDVRIPDDAPRRGPAFGAVVDRAALRALIDELWPALTPQQALRRVFASRVRLRHAARDVLDDGERDTLARPRQAPWTVADIALLDELAELLGPISHAPSDEERADAEALAAASLQLLESALEEEMEAALENREPSCPECQLELSLTRGPDGELLLTCTNFHCGGTWPAFDIIGEGDAQLLGAILEEVSDRFAPDETPTLRVGDRTYAHLVVDEAQEVSAMQWRALLRRCPTAAMTVAGDLDQASGPGALTSWDTVRQIAPTEADIEAVRLHVSYRTPAEVMDLTREIVDGLGAGLDVPESARRSGIEPRRFTDTRSPAELAADARRMVGDNGTIAVVVPADEAGSAHHPDVLAPAEAKGLEFDAVVVVDPAAIAASNGGVRALYVALTRTTRHLWVVDRD